MATKYYLDLEGLQALIRKIVANDKSVADVAADELSGVTGARSTATGHVGEYAAPSGTNYINSSSSLQNADVLLDTAIKAVDTRVNNLGTSSHAAATAGNGIQGNGTNGALDATHQQISVKAKTNGGITVDANGVSLDTTTAGVQLKKLTTATSGYASSYQLQLGNGASATALGDVINIPQDQFLKSVSLVDKKPTTAEGNSASVTFPALRFEWVLDTDDQTSGVQNITYVSVAALGGSGEVITMVPQGGGDTSWIEASGKASGHITSSTLASTLNSMDSSKTDSNDDNDITVTVRQANGLIAEVTVADTLADVAHSGKAADVSIADAGNKITATNVEGALQEIVTKIENTGEGSKTAIVTKNTSATADTNDAYIKVTKATDSTTGADTYTVTTTGIGTGLANAKTALTTKARGTETTSDSDSFIVVTKTTNGKDTYTVATQGIKDYVAGAVNGLGGEIHSINPTYIEQYFNNAVTVAGTNAPVADPGAAVDGGSVIDATTPVTPKT